MSKHTTLEQLRLAQQRTKLEVGKVETRVKALEDLNPRENVLEGVKVNGTALAIAEKMVDILIATGTANGSIKVNGTDISVAGLAALAYKAEVSEGDLAAALKAVIDAKAEDADLTALAGKVDVLIGSVEGDGSKSARVIAAEEVAKVVAEAPTSYDTLKEIADWIMNDTTGAAKMANDIAALKTKLTLGKDGSEQEYATVKAYVEAVTASFISLTALSATVTGDGNAITGMSYNNATGEFTFEKGETFLTPDDITGKADKVQGATNGNFAGLDANGNLTDSGKKASDFAASDHVHDVVTPSASGVGGTSGFMSAADKEKLDNITTATDAEVTAMLDEVWGA